MSAIRRRIFKDVQDGRDKIVIHQVQDCDEIIAKNRILMNANGSGRSSLWQGREYVKIAEVPLVWLDELAQKGLNYHNPDDWKIIKRLLNDKDFEKFRTAPGRF